jgi:hypothetical protein
MRNHGVPCFRAFSEKESSAIAFFDVDCCRAGGAEQPLTLKLLRKSLANTAWGKEVGGQDAFWKDAHFVHIRYQNGSKEYLYWTTHAVAKELHAIVKNYDAWKKVPGNSLGSWVHGSLSRNVKLAHRDHVAEAVKAALASGSAKYRAAKKRKERQGETRDRWNEGTDCLKTPRRAERISDDAGDLNVDGDGAAGARVSLKAVMACIDDNTDNKPSEGLGFDSTPPFTAQRHSTALDQESDVASPDHKNEHDAPRSRGTCRRCHEEVTTAQLRVKDKDGNYFHADCLQHAPVQQSSAALSSFSNYFNTRSQPIEID